MTEVEKKEFEEFLKWKEEKKSQEKTNVEVLENSPQPIKEKIESEQKNEIESKSEFGGLLSFAIIAVCFFFICFLISKCVTSNDFKPTIGEEKVTELEEDTVAVDTIEYSYSSKKIWNFSIRKDDMTDTNNIWATISSDNFISQQFPYEGETYASITVRYMKKYGYDVIIEITKGQIDGREYYGTDHITARFDGGSPKKYHFNESADGSSEMVFLRSSSDFIKRCKLAKDIKIDIPIYQAGRPVFSFHVDEPLVWREK